MNNELNELRQDLLTLLTDWIEGRVSEMDVLEIAEDLASIWGWKEFSRSDSRSSVMEVLSQLEIMHHQPILAKDAPVLIDFMLTAIENPEKSWRNWDQYWDSIDHEQRKKYRWGLK